MDGPQPQHLDYLPRPPLEHRVWNRLRWVLLAFVLFLAFVAIGPTAWRNTKLVYWQRLCMNFRAPANQIVYCPAAQIFVTPGPRSGFQAARGEPSATPATVFLHERVSPGGNRRLLIIDATLGLVEHLGMVDRVFEPGSPTSPALEVTRLGNTHHFLFDRAMKVFAGQPDESDKSHFTIKVVTSGGETILDGWLRDDDTVLIEPRPIRPAPSTATAGP